MRSWGINLEHHHPSHSRRSLLAGLGAMLTTGVAAQPFGRAIHRPAV